MNLPNAVIWNTPSYSASRDLWSENYHADLLHEILALAKDYPQIVGTFPFCFSDYRDPSKNYNGYWNELNLKGLVDYRRNRKLAFGTIGRAYRETPCHRASVQAGVNEHHPTEKEPAR